MSVTTFLSLTALIVSIAVFYCVYSGQYRKYSRNYIVGRHLSKNNDIEHRLSFGPKIVAIGGGTGLSTLLSGLKGYTRNITAVVAVTDEGGSSGRLRQEWGVLPPGDIRNCIVALAENDSSLNRLLFNKN